MKKIIFTCLFLAVSISIWAQNLTQFVNPFIGTSNEANANPGAVLPWGMVSISPFNAYDTINPSAWCRSPYVFGRKYISGFTNVNISGTGCPDLGTFCLMPTTGEISLVQSKNCSEYSDEIAEPGYYSVFLKRFNVRTELSTTLRSSISRYTFPEGESNILLNLGLGLTKNDGAVIKRISDTEVEGYKTIGDFCGLTSVQTIYFYAQLSKTPISCGVWDRDRKYPEFKREMAGSQIGAYFSFDTKENETIILKLGVSYVSSKNAKENLLTEQPGFDFDRVRKDAIQAWNNVLSKIQVEGGNQDDKVKFYTALYHTLMHPNIFNDVNGEYPAYESQTIAKTTTKDRFTIFSLWDTYRNVHPFLSLVFPKQQSAMVNSLVSMYKEGGWLPRWELAGMETGVMVGDPSLPVITDSYLRGIRDFDVNLAYDAMKHNATADPETNILRPGLEHWIKFGYIPDDAPNVMHNFPKDQYENMLRHRIIWGSVSTSLEYCIADWNLAQLAKSLGHIDDYKYFLNRSKYYVNSFDQKIGFMRAKLTNGQWLNPFDPTSHKLDCFTEGSAWNYTFMVPHDIQGLIKQIGGSQKFVQKLDSCFTQNYFDITNEPDIAYPYLFNYVKGEEWRTQKQVRKIIDTHFKNTPDGLPGNDDCGTMSTWLLYSMMGFYPTCPGEMNYQIASPVFSRITIDLDREYYPGKKFVIETSNSETSNYLVKSMKLNGKSHKLFSINHQQIIDGGKLSIELKSTK